MADSLTDYDYEIDEERRYTYTDYLKWDGPERRQLINGEVFLMASPSVEHQAVLGALHLKFGNWLEGKPCRVFVAPLDVRLFPKKDKTDNTVVQPDLMVICRNEIIEKNSIDGAPDLVVEILSPSNSALELIRKFQYYLKAGVREYWIVDLEEKKVQVNIFENGRVVNSCFLEDERVAVTVLPGLEINLKEIWELV